MMYIARCLLPLSLLLFQAQTASGQDSSSEPTATISPADPEEDYDSGRILPRKDVEARAKPASLTVLRVVGYPLHLFDTGLEKGLVSFEENRMREKLYYWQERLREKGVSLLFGGLGEGAGFGGGAIYRLRPLPAQEIQLLGNLTFRGYEEFDLAWSWIGENVTFGVAGSYQWRPQENFYGLGNESRKEDHTQFALRQSWSGLGGFVRPHRRLRVGAGYKWVNLKTVSPPRSSFPSPDQLFTDLVGFNERIQMHQGGVFFDADFTRGEYQWGGRSSLEASYQHRIGGNLEYWTYRVDAEGKMPVAPGRSALIGFASLELNRESSGSSPIPFFLHARVGGSSSMRGFALDRYFGRNLFFTSIEYRYALTPDIQAFIFFDEGQIFDTTDDLTWLNWHRNYGLGIKFKSGSASVVGLELGYGEEGLNFHLTLGDRTPRPLSGPVRYGSYRR